MKIMQVNRGFCYWDATNTYPTIESIIGKVAKNIVFVEAPDYVFEGWGYDDTKTGNDRFIQPIPPEGWIYNEGNGMMEPNEKIQQEFLAKSKMTEEESLEQQIIALQKQLQELRQNSESANTESVGTEESTTE